MFSAPPPPPPLHALIMPPMQNRLALRLCRVAEADTEFIAHVTFLAEERKLDVELGKSSSVAQPPMMTVLLVCEN